MAAGIASINQDSLSYKHDSYKLQHKNTVWLIFLVFRRNFILTLQNKGLISSVKSLFLINKFHFPTL